MATKRTKGDHGHADHGSRERHQGNAVTASGLDPDVAEARRQQEGMESDSAINDPE